MDAPLISGDVATVWCRVIAPIRTTSSPDSTNASSSTRLMSTSTVGRASRRFMSGTRLWPACQQLGVVSVLVEQRDRLLQGPGRAIRELGRLHETVFMW